MRPPDGKWGAKTANGSWNGMVGMLHRREVDMALGPFSITKARYEAVNSYFRRLDTAFFFSFSL